MKHNPEKRVWYTAKGQVFNRLADAKLVSFNVVAHLSNGMTFHL